MTQLNLQPETPSATAEVDALNVDLSNLSREELTELAFARLLTVMKAGTGFAPSELTIGGSKIFVALIDDNRTVRAVPWQEAGRFLRRAGELNPDLG